LTKPRHPRTSEAVMIKMWGAATKELEAGDDTATPSTMWRRHFTAKQRNHRRVSASKT
jgi:hypothetical protein